MTQREAIHEVIDYLPDDALAQVEALLARLQRERLMPAVQDVPEEDEELSPAELRAMERGEADIAAGRVVQDQDLEAAIDRLARAGS